MITEDLEVQKGKNIGMDDNAAAAAAKSIQSCPTLCDPIDGGPPGSPVPEILQARTLEWVAISFSSAWKWKVKVKSLSCVRLFATPWSAAFQALPSMGFSRQEYWSGVPLPSLIFLNDTNKHTKQKRTYKYLKQTWLPKGKMRWRVKARVWRLQTQTTKYEINNKDLLHSTRNSTQCSVITYMGKNLQKEWICVYV